LLIIKSASHEFKYNLPRNKCNYVVRDVRVHSRKTHLVVGSASVVVDSDKPETIF